ncbi:MAG: hypothetical protein HY355_05090 [Armatimonadetes bacterium]|nr:hypothetical protein [Armatimonadota bacterium]
MEDRSIDLTERIAFAEGWLARARRQVQDGHHARSLLTLMLAEAEMHRARELATVVPPSSLSRHPWVQMALTVSAAVVLVGLVLVAWRPGLSADPVAADRSGPPIVVLPGASGSMLRMVQAAEAPAEAPVVVKSVIVRVAVPVAAPQLRLDISAPPPPPVVPAAAPAQRHDAPSASASAAPASAAAAPAAAAATPPLLSEADLIDLVLAAERSLRRANH